MNRIVASDRPLVRAAWHVTACTVTRC